MRYGLGVVSTALAVALTGCSFSASFGTPEVEEKELEAQLMDELENDIGQRPDSVDCPGDLKGEVDEEMRCTLTAGGDEVGMTVTVTEVDDDRVRFEAQVDDVVSNSTEDEESEESTESEEESDETRTPAKYPTVDQSEVETQVANSLEESVGQRPDSIECPGDLDGVVGTEMRCTLHDGDVSYGLTVTVTDVVGTSVNFDIQVDDEPM